MISKTNVVLISCVKKKLTKKCSARDLYISPLFKLSLKYAKSLDPDCIYILSAKHGLVELDQELEPYELTLNKLPMHDIKDWADQVIKDIYSKHDIDKTIFTILAGKNYYRFLLPHLKYLRLPLENLKLGHRLRKLKELAS